MNDNSKTANFMAAIESTAEAAEAAGNHAYAEMLRLYAGLMGVYLPWSDKQAAAHADVPATLDAIFGALASVAAGVIRTVCNDEPGAVAALSGQAASAFSEHLKTQLKGATLFGMIGRLDS